MGEVRHMQWWRVWKTSAPSSSLCSEPKKTSLRHYLNFFNIRMINVILLI